MISRVSALEFAAHHFDQGIPAIVVDALEAWGVEERWAPPYLAEIAKDRQVTVGIAKDGRYFYNDSKDLTRFEYDQQDIAFGEAIRLISDEHFGNQIYILQQPVREKLPELMENMEVPYWIRSQRPMVNLWLGRDTCGPLHYDYLNNFFAQLHGSKRFVICAPHDTAYVYPYRCDAFMSHCSHVDVNSPDRLNHPKFAFATPTVVELRAGDLLFLPAFWWHQVQGVGLSVSVSFWWPPRAAQFFESPNSARDLHRFYHKDRLAEFKRTCLEPARHDFLSAAAILLEQGRTWGAAVLAIAAFDEALSGTLSRQRPEGCALADLSAELKQVWPLPSQSDLSSQSTRVRLEDVLPIVEMAASCEDDQIGHREVLGLFDAVVALKSAVPLVGAQNQVEIAPTTA